MSRREVRRPLSSTNSHYYSTDEERTLSGETASGSASMGQEHGPTASSPLSKMSEQAESIDHGSSVMMEGGSGSRKHKESNRTASAEKRKKKRVKKEDVIMRARDKKLSVDQHEHTRAYIFLQTNI